MSLPSAIGRYEIVRQIGQGGMGKVLLAWDPMLERQVTIKLLNDEQRDDLRQRFTREARSAARLRHPNIVTIFDVGEDNGQPFIAMAYIQGRTLDELIKQNEPLSLARKLQLIEEVCAGLGYAHKSGIVHRDIKPANLMIDSEDVLQILDFGIAHIAGSGMTQSGMLMGTLTYMSPEQLTGRTVDQRSDLFAVGAVFYEFLSGKPAFSGSFHDGLFHRILNEPPEPLETLCPALPPDVVAVVTRALEKDPDKRYPDAASMRADIQRIRRRLESLEEGGDAVLSITSLDVIATQKHRARQAFAAADYDRAVMACESVLMLAPDDAEAIELLDRARLAIDKRQAGEWLNEAGARLQGKDLSGASSLVNQALTIEPGSTRAQQLRHEIDQARRQNENAPISVVAPSTPAGVATVAAVTPAPLGAVVTPTPSPDSGSAPGTVIRNAPTRSGRTGIAIAAAIIVVATAAAMFWYSQQQSAVPPDTIAGTPVQQAPAVPSTAATDPAPSQAPPVVTTEQRAATAPPQTPPTAALPAEKPKPTPPAPTAPVKTAPESTRPPASTPPPAAAPETTSSVAAQPPSSTAEIPRPPVAPPPPPKPDPEPPRVTSKVESTPAVASASKLAAADEEGAIRSVLAAYARAYTNLDVQAVRRVYPTINADGLSNAFRDIREQRVVISNERIKVNGNSATVLCTVFQSYTPRVGSGRETSVEAEFALQKTDDGWIIAARRR